MKCSVCRAEATTYTCVVFDNDQTDYWDNYFCDDHADDVEREAQKDKTVVEIRKDRLP